LGLRGFGVFDPRRARAMGGVPLPERTSTAVRALQPSMSERQIVSFGVFFITVLVAVIIVLLVLIVRGT
jgi:hypothetical protein